MDNLTLAAAIFAGLLSFLSPCVLPVVPAYLGQLGAVSVATAPGIALTGSGAAAGALTALSGSVAPAAPRTRWQLLFHALAFVVGFGAVFTLLGIGGAYAGQALGRNLPFLRQIGGVILIILGLNLAGILRFSLLARTWKPFQRFGGAPVASRTPLGAVGLGAVFAVGWTPCIGPTLGAIFGLSAFGATAQAGLLFAAYSLGLGIPFIAMAVAMDRLRPVTRRLVRYGRAIELVGGLLVVVIGVAILFDWLTLIYQRFAQFAPLV